MDGRRKHNGKQKNHVGNACDAVYDALILVFVPEVPATRIQRCRNTSSILPKGEKILPDVKKTLRT